MVRDLRRDGRNERIKQKAFSRGEIPGYFFAVSCRRRADPDSLIIVQSPGDFVQFPGIFVWFPGIVVQFFVVPGIGSVAPGAFLCSPPRLLCSPPRGRGRLPGEGSAGKSARDARGGREEDAVGKSGVVTASATDCVGGDGNGRRSCAGADKNAWKNH